MNNSLKEKGLDSYVKAHKRSLVTFLNFKKKFKVKQSIIRGGRKIDSYVLI